MVARWRSWDNSDELERYFDHALRAVPGQTILVDRYFQGIEVEVDAVCDGRDVLIPGVMQHIERAGVHSGDSFAVYPAIWLTGDEVETIVEYTRRIGRMLNCARFDEHPIRNHRRRHIP